MSRVLTGLAVTVMAAAATGQALAADWSTGHAPIFKPAYPADMGPMEDSLDFEAGLRYFYGRGGRSATLGGPIGAGGGTYSSEETSHIVELHGRIDDHSTETYLKGSIGYAALIEGQYDNPLESGSISGGTVASARADFGYMPLRNNGFSAGAFIGYQYLNESPDTGRAQYLVPDTLQWAAGSPLYSVQGDNGANMLEVHALRLGVAGQVELSPMFDISAEVAAIPYASLSGNLGAQMAAFETIGASQSGQSSATSIDGHLYGGAVELMAGFNPTENLSIRLGARGYYLTGPVTARYSTTTIVEPLDMDGDGTFETAPTVATQGYERQLDDFELFRWGPVIEVTGRF